MTWPTGQATATATATMWLLFVIANASDALGWSFHSTSLPLGVPRSIRQAEFGAAVGINTRIQADRRHLGMTAKSALNMSTESSARKEAAIVSNFLGRKNEATQPQPYVRWQQSESDSAWQMQTAVTTFRRGDETVELHAQIHYGDKSYFEYYSSQYMKSLDSVHYELLVDDSLLAYQGGSWRLDAPIMAAPSDQQFARQYGWECQVDAVDYSQPHWIHSDFSRQEFLKMIGKDGDSAAVPLWKAASNPQSSSAAAEAISALLVGPPTLSFSSRRLQRRLFTNLFLPGDALANYIRAVLWLTVPTPEVSIALFDWASILQGGRTLNGVSRVAIPITSNLLRLNIQQVRRLLFGQALISSTAAAVKSSDDPDGWSNVVLKRNDRALDVLESTLRSHRTSSSGPSSKYSTALLYGCSHCPDLHAKLVERGFRPSGTTWRTAWAVKGSPPTGSIVPVTAVVATTVSYLSIGALDWVSMMGDVSQSWLASNYIDAGLAAGFYLVRHVLLYLALSKFFVDWNGDEGEAELKT